MALQFQTAYRNTLLDAFETAAGTAIRIKIFSGAVPANCAAADPSGLLATVVAPSDYMNNAAAGAKTGLGLPWTVAATGTGTALSFRVYDSGVTTCFMQGTCGQGSGDLSLDNTSIVSGQNVNVTTFTLTAPGA